MATKKSIRRPYTVNGVTWNLIQRGDVWYAQRRDASGRRITRSTKQTTLKDAHEVIDQWADEERNPTKLRHFAEVLFLPGSLWIERQGRRRDGEPLSERTIYEHKLHVEKYIIPSFGDRDPATITAPEIEDWLYSIDVSNRYRRNIAGTLKIVLAELHRKGIVSGVPPVELPTKHSHKPRPFTDEEIALLFSSAEPWGRAGEEEWVAPMLMSCFAAMTFGGLRPQEARALHRGQAMPDQHAILITRQCNARNEVVEYLKTGGRRDPKYRGTLLSNRGWEAFYQWAGKIEDGLLYTLDGERPIRKEFLRDRLKATAKRLGLEPGLRPYSGRYTFITRYKPILEGDLLRTLTGHVDEAMPQQYHRPFLEAQMKQLQGARKLLDSID